MVFSSLWETKEDSKQQPPTLISSMEEQKTFSSDERPWYEFRPLDESRCPYRSLPWKQRMQDIREAYAEMRAKDPAPIKNNGGLLARDLDAEIAAYKDGIKQRHRDAWKAVLETIYLYSLEKVSLRKNHYMRPGLKLSRGSKGHRLSDKAADRLADFFPNINFLLADSERELVLCHIKEIPLVLPKTFLKTIKG